MTEHPVDDWARLYEAGASYRAIGAAAGVDESKVRRALAGRVPRRRPGPKKRAEVTAEQVASVFLTLGGNIKATEATLGVSETLVRARLSELGYVEHPDQRPRKWSRTAPPQ